MTDELTYGRETVVIVEIEQSRCTNRFGVAPCTATGTPKCYQCYWTCKDTENYNTNGSLVWRFSRPQDRVDWLYEQNGANNIKTNALPFVLSYSTTSSKINPGASRTGESPLGVRSKATVVFDSPPWDDHVGDFYLADRTQPSPLSDFWALWSARNPFYPDMVLRVYEGYVGQDIDDMQVRVFDVENVEGPDAQNRWTVTGRDPLDKARGDNAKYPPTSDIDLAQDITASQSTIAVTCLESELDLVLGNVDEFYATIGDEIIQYSGYTGTEPDLTLTGVERGRLGTSASSHSSGDAVQRAVRFQQYELYNVALDILTGFVNIPASYIPSADWQAEGVTFLPTLKCTTTLSQPENVEDLLGELCRDGLFYIWWDDRAQEIKMEAVKPPQVTPDKWTDGGNVLLSSLRKTAVPDDRMTRVTVFFGQRDPTEGIETESNYRSRRIRVDAEVEGEVAAGGTIVENTIYSRWINSSSNALLVGASLLLRYRLPPQYVTLSVDAKDRSADLADVIDLTARGIVDTEGNRIESRWQIIQMDETEAGHKLQVRLQSYQFVGKFAIIMANDAPVYADATEEERLSGCWLADDATGLMPDGTEPYLLQ